MTVEVNILWFQKLMELAKRVEQDQTELPTLLGYISSAESIIDRAEG